VHYDGFEDLGLRIPPVESEVELLERHYGAAVLGIALNGQGLTERQMRSEARRLQTALGRPVSMPLLDGGEPLFGAVESFVRTRAGRP
jgi:uncharacterized NAD-dependent epimerase/dehydratase family protein